MYPIIFQLHVLLHWFDGSYTSSIWGQLNLIKIYFFVWTSGYISDAMNLLLQSENILTCICLDNIWRSRAPVHGSNYSSIVGYCKFHLNIWYIKYMYSLVFFYYINVNIYVLAMMDSYKKILYTFSSFKWAQQTLLFR